ncbi:MAG TPA: hypothetical protein VD884_20955 [Ohtaekwangia sp.]|nr:hypothetical protein [Ohtaekwangia sp.]
MNDSSDLYIKMENQVESLDRISAGDDCENCNTPVTSGNKYCSHCSFPAGGDEHEKRSFRLIVSSRKRLLDDAQKKIKSAKITIYILAGIFFVAGIFFWVFQEDVGTLVVYLLMSLIYLILAAWCEKNPFGAILTAFVIYITLQVIAAFVDPVSIVSGIIIKVFIIAALVKGIRSAREAQNYRNELLKLKIQPVGIA